MTLFKMFEGERDMFLQRTHTFLEEKLSKSFGLELSFGQLRIGNFQEIVLEDLTFKFPEKENFLLMLPRVHLQRRRGATEVSFKEGHFLWGGKKIDRLKGQLFVSLEEPSPGPLALFERVHVEGMFQEGGGIQLTLRKRNLLAFEGKVVLQDFKWGERNFSGTGDILFLIRNRNHPWKDFKVKTIWHHLRLEEVPLDDLVGRFLIAQNTLFIEKLQWGNALSFSGETAFSSPYETSGRLRFLKLEREHLKHFVSPSKKIPRHVEGQFLLHGPLQKIHINGHLVSYEGRVKDIDYEKLNATLQGNWPIVRVELRVEREFPKESSLTVLGVMDLAELGRKGFYKTISLQEADAVVWKGVSFQNPTDETIVFGKGNQTTSVSLKAFLNQDPLVEIREEEFELEYKLREDKSLKMRLRGEEEFLGLEHHLNF